MNGNVTLFRPGTADLRIPGYWSKLSWMDQGIGTPETALQTLLWALRENCWKRAEQVMLANPPCPAVFWDDIVSENGAIKRGDELFILARLDERADRAIIMGQLRNRLDGKIPIMAFYMVRIAHVWNVDRLRVL